eukprot:8972542-Ditylum_brightwellii.AAC.1
MHWDLLESKLHSVGAARDYCPSSPSNASTSSGWGVSTSGAMLDEEQKKNMRHFNEGKPSCGAGDGVAYMSGDSCKPTEWAVFRTMVINNYYVSPSKKEE